LLHEVTHLITTYVSVQSPTFRVTRARLHTQDHEHALQILEEQTMPVVVDHGRLTKFLDSTVSLTKNYKIEKLEKLYSLYTSCIYSHCQDYDKTLMIEVSMISRVCVVLHMPRYSWNTAKVGFKHQSINVGLHCWWTFLRVCPANQGLTQFRLFQQICAFMHIQSNLGASNLDGSNTMDGSNWFESPVNFPYISK
jgi:hypothetical protein